MEQVTQDIVSEPLQRTLPTCKWCGKDFTPNPRNHTKINQDFCNSKCRWKHWDKENPRKRKGE